MPFDLIVIGSGPAGYVGAIRAAQLGMSVACIEKDPTLGGTCLNVGCIPSKALLDSSEKYEKAQHEFASHGIEISSIKLNIDAMMKRKETVVKTLTQGIAGLFKKNKITSLQGTGKLIDVKGALKTVEVTGAGGTTTHQAKSVLIATGSTPIELPTLKFDGTTIISSTEALSLKAVPKRLAVVGAGVIGLELGSVWKRLGSHVTVIEFMDKLLPRLDRQVAREVEKSFKKQGLEFHFSTKVVGATKTKSGITLSAEDVPTGTKKTIEADVVLVATGRRPYTDGLGLENVGVTKDDKGRINIDDHFQTNVPGVFAVGDVVRGPMLAHKGEEEAIAAVELMAGKAGHVNYDVIPDVIYTWPEIATVGKTEDECKALGWEVKTGSFPFLANARSKAMSENEGVVKIVAHAKNDRVLGATIFGPGASELIAEIASVMEFGGSSEDIARTCHAHPTLSETVKEAALDVEKRRINL